MNEKISIPADKRNITSLSHARSWIESETIGKSFNENKSLANFLNFKTISSVSYLSPPVELPINRTIKRWINLIIATFFIAAILWWLTPVLAILIKADSKGPVLFFQKRNKKNGRLFTCIKFRSMIVNEEADMVQAKENDIRITHIGKFLRKHHLDELPQFINVLLGDMSVIGPRPHMVSDNLKYQNLINQYSFRSKVKPGMTGLAQVCGYAGPVTDIEKMKTRVMIDNFYIRHWSLKLDIMILYKTALKAIG